MGSIRKIMAAMLVSLAFTAYQSDAGAQARKSESRTENRTSRRSTGSSGSSPHQRKSGTDIQSRKAVTSSASKNGTIARPSSVKTSATRPSVTRPSSERKPSSTVTRPSSQTRPAAVSSTVTRPTRVQVEQKKNMVDSRPDVQEPVQVTRPAPSRQTTSGNRPSERPGKGPDNRYDKGPDKGKHGPGYIRPDHRHDRPRVHPRDRDFMRWNKPSHFWSHYNHCFGHRVRVLPRHVHRHVYHGMTYYCYNDIWYRPYEGYYVVCRPPYGISLAANLIADMAWDAVRLSYYFTAQNTYGYINENNAYIAEQNAIIAQNNAIIAAQNAQIAQGQHLATASFNLANTLGLIQSFAAAGSEYFYQDGVFYAADAVGEYRVIIPPSGALVETLPDDYDIVTLRDGNEYYMVDNTVYKVTIVEGKPYFEVIGQQYS